MTFKLTSPVRQALAVADDLGFDNALLACEAILTDENWQENWDMSDLPAEAEILQAWRTQMWKEHAKKFKH